MKNQPKFNFDSPSLKINKIGDNRFSAFSNKTGSVSFSMSDKKGIQIKDKILILKQPVLKTVEPLAYLDSYDHDIFKKSENTTTGYTTLRVTNFSHGERVKYEFPHNYFSDKALSCDTNQIELINKGLFYSVRSPSSIAFKHNPNAQIISLKAETKEYSLDNSVAHLIKKNPTRINKSSFAFEQNTMDVIQSSDGKRIILKKEKIGYAYILLNFPKKAFNCISPDHFFISESEEKLFFLNLYGKEIKVFSLKKVKLNEKLLLEKKFNLPKQNYVLLNYTVKGSSFVFQLMTSAKQSIQNYGIENFTLHYNSQSQETKKLYSKHLSFKSKLIMHNTSIFFSKSSKK